MTLDWRGDLANLPRLLRSPAILITVAIQIAITIIALASRPIGADSLVGSLLVNFVFPPPLLAIILAAVLARRSRYLAGGIVAAVGVPLLGVFLFVAAGSDLYNDVAPIAFVQALILSTIFGLVIGGMFDIVVGLFRFLTRTGGSESIGQIRELGDLRDRGLITPAEFEAKKDALLRRVG